MRPLQHLRALLAVGVFTATLVAARAQAEAPAEARVIERGQEDLVAAMLGKATPLPGGCAWAGASVEQTRIVSSYACAAGRVELELRHPSDTSDGADAVAGTDRFALRVRAGAAPPGLLDAIVARLRARESAFTWTASAPAPVQGPEAPGPALRGLGLALAVTAVTAALMRWVHRRLAGRAPALAAPRSTVAAAALALALAIGLAAAVHSALHAFGDAALGSLERRPPLAIVVSAITMLVYLTLAVAASALSALLPRIRATLPRGIPFAVGALLYVAVAYPRSLAREPPTALGDVAAGRPNVTFVDVRADRPRVTVHLNDLGFRDPPWAIEKPEGTYRIGLVGDSYVFGIGVEGDDTLSSALTTELARRAPGRRVEVVNLGIPGANITSYVDVYAVSARLSLDVAVVCLTLPNDLSRWDVRDERREAQRLGAFSATRFLFGDAAGPFWSVVRLESRTTAAGLAHFDRELARLTRVRAAEARPPALLFYAFRDMEPAIHGRLTAVPGARVLPDVPTRAEDFLPRDGHPTPLGNRRSAERLADALDLH